jgi:CheY-like chemotaxis protein
MAKTILVADDEADILKLVSVRLSKRGYQVLAATNGQEALDLLAQQTPDLVILDYRMPLVNGDEVCKRLKADERLKNIPVLFLSASPGLVTQKTLQAIGVEDVLIKPFEAASLFEMVDRFIGAA